MVSRYDREGRSYDRGKKDRPDSGSLGDFPWQDSGAGDPPAEVWEEPPQTSERGGAPGGGRDGQGAGSAAPPGNGMAVAGFVLSILALILSRLSLIDLVFILPAIVFSAIGLRRANRQARPHRRLAIAGLWISLAATVIMIVLTIIYVVIADDIAATPVATHATTTTIAGAAVAGE